MNDTKRTIRIATILLSLFGLVLAFFGVRSVESRKEAMSAPEPSSVDMARSDVVSDDSVTEETTEESPAVEYPLRPTYRPIPTRSTRTS